MSDSLWPHRLYSPWNSPGHNTGVGDLSLLQGLELRSPALQVDSLPAEPQGSPRIQQWVAYPFSSRSSWLRNEPGSLAFAGRFFTNWAIREAQQSKEKRMKRNEDSLTGFWDNIKHTNIGAWEEEKVLEKIFEDIIVENFCNVERKGKDPPKSRKCRESHTG